MSDFDSHVGADSAPSTQQNTDRVSGGIARAWWFVPAIVAATYFAAHLCTATRYGYFRDALYYLACSEHLDWGYIDQPPLIAVVAWLARHTFGTSLRALLLWPVLAGCGRIILVAAFARELGEEAIRSGIGGGARGGSCSVDRHRSSVRDECIRAAVLDGMRVCVAAHDSDRRRATVARVRRDWRAGPREQILDGIFCGGTAAGIAAHSRSENCYGLRGCWRAAASRC